MNIVGLVNKKNVKFDTTIHQTKGILDYVYSNVWGPMKNISLGEKKGCLSPLLMTTREEFGCIP